MPISHTICHKIIRTSVSGKLLTGEALGVLTTYIIYCISYNMGKRDLPDIYAQDQGQQAQGHRQIYQANSECPVKLTYISNKSTKSLKSMHKHNWTKFLSPTGNHGNGIYHNGIYHNISLFLAYI